MKISFLARARYALLLALLGAAGLLTTACGGNASPESAPVDYSAADEAAINKYLADKKITTAQRQPSGLYYVPVKTNASGVPAKPGNTVSVLYTGSLLSGKVFDASSLHGTAPYPPFDFVLGQHQVIAGWDDGIALLHKGEKGMLLIPSALGYGPDGAGSDIPPNAVLRFDVELVDVK